MQATARGGEERIGREGEARDSTWHVPMPTELCGNVDTIISRKRSDKALESSTPDMPKEKEKNVGGCGTGMCHFECFSP